MKIARIGIVLVDPRRRSWTSRCPRSMGTWLSRPNLTLAAIRNASHPFRRWHHALPLRTDGALGYL